MSVSEVHKSQGEFLGNATDVALSLPRIKVMLLFVRDVSDEQQH